MPTSRRRVSADAMRKQALKHQERLRTLIRLAERKIFR
jgi:hypothetical protein